MREEAGERKEKTGGEKGERKRKKGKLNSQYEVVMVNVVNVTRCRTAKKTSLWHTRGRVSGLG